MSVWRSARLGALLALILVAGTIVGGYVYMRSGEGHARLDAESPVVLIFESPALDGATVAALISIVEGGRIRDVSPDTTVTVSGTSSNRLGGAYVFGGGPSVVEALHDAGDVGSAAFVIIPESAWHQAVSSAHGVLVNVPRSLTVFDGTRLTSIKAGWRFLSSAEVSALLRGLSFFQDNQRATLRGELEQQLVSALVASPPTLDLVESDLSPDALRSWLGDYLPEATVREVD